jgi:hypothetical protein
MNRTDVVQLMSLCVCNQPKSSYLLGYNVVYTVNVIQRCEGKYCLSLQGRSVSQALPAAQVTPISCLA